MTKLLSILSLATLAQPASFIAPISKIVFTNNDSKVFDYAVIDGNVKKTDNTVHYEGNSGDCYDVFSDKYIKGSGTYFKDPEAIKLETTSRSTRLRMLMQQYSFDVVVPPNTENYSIQLTVPLRFQAYLNGFIFGTKFDATVHLFNQRNDEGIGFKPTLPEFISWDALNCENICVSKEFHCSHNGQGSWREYDQTWSNIYLSTKYNLFNYNETEPRVRKCYFSLALFIRGQIDWLNGNTGATLKLQDDIKLEKI